MEEFEKRVSELEAKIDELIEHAEGQLERERTALRLLESQTDTQVAGNAVMQIVLTSLAHNVHELKPKLAQLVEESRTQILEQDRENMVRIFDNIVGDALTGTAHK